MSTRGRPKAPQPPRGQGGRNPRSKNNQLPNTDLSSGSRQGPLTKMAGVQGGQRGKDPNSRGSGYGQSQMSENDKNKARGKTIGAYMVGKSIGEGTFGKVKMGTHIATGEKVAIKILEKSRIIEVSDEWLLVWWFREQPPA